MVLYPTHPWVRILCWSRGALSERTRGNKSGAEWMVLVAVFMGSASAVLGSLFGQLQREVLTSPAEVNPDRLVCGAATVWAASAAPHDFLIVLLSVDASFPQLSFRVISHQLINFCICSSVYLLPALGFRLFQVRQHIVPFLPTKNVLKFRTVR